MQARPLVATMFCLVAAGCDSAQNANLNARLGWQFDYRDWTKSSAAADLRGCDNVGALTDVTPYTPIAMVHVRIADPTGQTPGVDEDIACLTGESGFTEIKGLVRQTYTLTLAAKSAEGDVLYESPSQDIDLASVLEETVTLRAAVGELHFFARYPGATLTCPDNVHTLHYVLRELESNFAVEGDSPACLFGTSQQLLLRDIPTHPREGVGDSYAPSRYELRLSANDNAGNTLFCSVSERLVGPGNDNLNQDETLAAGACP